MGEWMGVTPSGPWRPTGGWGVRACTRAAQKALKGDDRHTRTDKQSLHYIRIIIIVVVVIIIIIIVMYVCRKCLWKQYVIVVSMRDQSLSLSL